MYRLSFSRVSEICESPRCLCVLLPPISSGAVVAAPVHGIAISNALDLKTEILDGALLLTISAP